MIARILCLVIYLLPVSATTKSFTVSNVCVNYTNLSIEFTDNDYVSVNLGANSYQNWCLTNVKATAVL